MAERVKTELPDPDPVVLGLARGGVPVAFEVARALPAQLDVFLVRKLGYPGQEELAVGAIASGGGQVLNQDLLRVLPIPPQTLAAIADRERAILNARELLYRGDRSPVPIEGRTVLLIDDGLATGASMMAAALAVRPLSPRSVTVAVPVAAQEACADLRRYADRVICLATPEPFSAVGLWYEDFSQITDDEVTTLLRNADGAWNARRPRQPSPYAPKSPPDASNFTKEKEENG